MIDTHIAWAAGLFEGEGSACISSGQPRIAVSMTDEDVVRRFAEIVDCGNVRRYHYPATKRKPYWQWSAQSATDVLHVLGLLYPYLGLRRQERVMEIIERAAKIGAEAGFCKRGHDLTDPQHLYLHRKTGKRHCRTCRRDYQRRWTQRLAN
jgi:hypothetical protein